jgi:hypothetical protein
VGEWERMKIVKLAVLSRDIAIFVNISKFLKLKEADWHKYC